MQSRSLHARTERVRELLAGAVANYAPVVFASSFGAEDMVLLDIIASGFRDIEIVTLDTGRLPPETYDLIQQASEAYRRKVKVYFPQGEAVEKLVRTDGINGFYASIAQRKTCCEVRKLEPLQRALAGNKAWITGLRRSQSVTRQHLGEAGFDPDHGLQKFNPLIDWSDDDVWSYIGLQNVPYNALHDRGYPSIGCAPCTRAVAAGDDVRAGRWWWESSGSRECGLHKQAVTA